VVAGRDGHRGCGGGRAEGVAKARGGGGPLVVAAVVMPDSTGLWARRRAAEEEEPTVLRRRRGVVGEEELSLSGGWRHAGPHLTRNNILCPVGARRACAMCLLALVHWTPVLPAGRPFPPAPPVRIFLAILLVLLRHNFLFSRMEKVTWSLMLILSYILLMMVKCL